MSDERTGDIEAGLPDETPSQEPIESIPLVEQSPAPAEPSTPLRPTPSDTIGVGSSIAIGCAAAAVVVIFIVILILTIVS